jgi:endogenous inhibitor of DNA gyrase (YacG/DUF329 family)
MTQAGVTQAGVTQAGSVCPICGKPTVAAHRPFCCARCADIDLGRWFGEAYRIPAEPAEPDGDPPG